ncbi:MAG: hypothetical protein R2991_01540 [Thermoanaerobaculia bacterium]
MCPDPAILCRRIPGLLGTAAATLLLAVVGMPTPAAACSICRCGDTTFNALGRDGYAAAGWRLALDWERFDKDEGEAEEGQESQVENRTTALVSYGFNDRFTLAARVPYSRRELTESEEGESETTRTDGLSDPEIYAQLRLWASSFAGDLGRRASLTGTLGVKTPWGENDLEAGGERLDEHAQPGTGSTDVFGGLGFLYLLDARSALFASASYRAMGENDRGYRYGDVASASFAWEHKLGRRFDGVLALDARSAGKDREDGVADGDTGGELLYLSPRLLVDLGRGLVLRAGAQVPIADDLNGHQTERAVLNVGMTWVLAP